MIGIEQLILQDRPTPTTVAQQLAVWNVSLATNAGEAYTFQDEKIATTEVRTY